MYVYIGIYLFIWGTSFRLHICCFFLARRCPRAVGRSSVELPYVRIYSRLALHNAFPPQLNLLQAFAKTPDFIIVYQYGLF